MAILSFLIGKSAIFSAKYLEIFTPHRYLFLNNKTLCLCVPLNKSQPYQGAQNVIVIVIVIKCVSVVSVVSVRLSRLSPLFIGDVRWCQCLKQKFLV